jgi:hypothetical protein
VEEWKCEDEDRSDAAQARKGTGKTLKVGCDMKGGRGGGFRWGDSERGDSIVSR